MRSVKRLVLSVMQRKHSSVILQRDDPILNKMIELLNKVFESMFMEMIFPRLYHMFPGLFGQKAQEEQYGKVKAFMKSVIDEHKANLVPGQPKVK